LLKCLSSHREKAQSLKQQQQQQQQMDAAKDQAEKVAEAKEEEKLRELPPHVEKVLLFNKKQMQSYRRM
jgi:hypothetical protein